MNNAEKFEKTFGIYATEMWAMPESEFLSWLNSLHDVNATNTTDTISRQDAIDALYCTNPTEPYIHIDDAVKAIKELPSVESQIIRCKDCKHRVVNEHYGEKGYFKLKAYCDLDTGDIFELGRCAEEDDWFCADAERREEG